MKKTVFWALLVMILAFGMTVVGCDNDPKEEKTTALQVYTLSGTTFTEYAGSGSEQEVTGWITDGPSEGSSLGKIGTISSDGKLTLELPSSIADNKLFELPQGYGDGKFAMARVFFGNGEKLELYNSSDVNKIIIFTYFSQNATANGWNYIETEWGSGDNQIISQQVVTNISSHKWVITGE